MLARVFRDFEKQKHAACEHFLAPGDGYIDIGANKGDFAIHTAIRVGSSGRVVAFEPEKKNYEWIKKSILASKLDNIALDLAHRLDRWSSPLLDPLVPYHR